ncbi:MAG TPA: NUDIX domain-containing protein, partial [Vicinamibacteria bacterium]
MIAPPVAQNIKVAVDNCIFTVTGRRLQLLLIRMRKKPFEGMWALPGGLIDEGESLKHAASRRLSPSSMRPPGSAHMPSKGLFFILMSSTWRRPSTTVKMQLSTATLT